MNKSKNMKRERNKQNIPIVKMNEEHGTEINSIVKIVLGNINLVCII